MSEWVEEKLKKLPTYISNLPEQIVVGKLYILDKETKTYKLSDEDTAFLVYDGQLHKGFIKE